MGKYPVDWDRHLKGIGQRGYNMVHFTPLMKRGSSNSPYSLYDQLAFDEAFFPNGEADVAALVERMEQEDGLLALTDVVWNHTAHNSRWLQEHPEVGYSVETAPWLEAALELDDALLEYGRNLKELGLPTEFKTAEDLLVVMNHMREQVINKIRLWEFYAIDIEHNATSVVDAWVAGKIEYPSKGFGDVGVGGLAQIREWSLKEKADFLREKALLNRDHIMGRYGRAIQPGIGAALLTALYGRYEPDSSKVPDIRAEFVKILDQLNLTLYLAFDQDVLEIFDQIYNRVKYLRLDDHGPKLGPVTEKNPFIETYFTRLPLNETTKRHSTKSLALVNNGWVWNADAMRDHAGKESRAYLRREVIVWGDCVKLRYGNGPSDSPFLWDYMAQYTRLMAKLFGAFRIDNCHSTPLHVAEYLLDEARRVRPDLVVFAELFTGAEETDYVFTKRLGLTSLIREAMQAWSPGELSRLVHRHGGRPIGSFDINLLEYRSQPEEDNIVHHVEAATIPALFMDCTHDNEMPAQKRDPRDTLPNAALVAMCATATGSVFGYDEIYPKHINLVQEHRQYSSPYSEGNVSDSKEGIGAVKKVLNDLHTRMAVDGYDETHIHHDGEYITVHRVHPHTRKGVFLIARTAFPGSENGKSLDPVYLAGTKVRPAGSWKLEVENDPKSPAKESGYLEGLPSRLVELDSPAIEDQGNTTIVRPPADFPPGSISLLETWIPGEELAANLSEFITSGADEAFSALDLVDLNLVLYRCGAEEKDSSDGNAGVYDIPNCGPLVYAGLQGWWSLLENIIKHNDLGHPLCANLRDGQWAIDYIVGRMQRAISKEGYHRLQDAANWLESRFNAVRRVPNFLLPRYFAIIVKTAYEAAWRHGILLGSSIEKGQHFIHELSMVSVQQVGFVKSSSLYPTKQVPCLAAGLPHFSTDWARCWGRDVFISLRGLLLCTGRFDDAREHILAFASVLKHGMIPNLLSSGREPRYNSRDSVWFFLQAIQDYANVVPDGIRILDEKVQRRFLPFDDTWFSVDDPRAYSQTSTVAEVIQEVFQRHASGISFREHNAGPSLDMQMKSEGFQVDIKVDWDTGIIFGGNQWNCGTWMDKMGESEKAGSKGHPGTPRDGAAVEITGLLYSSLDWVSKLHQQGVYKHSGVRLDSGEEITFENWASRIKGSFERCYYVPLDPREDSQYDVDPKVLHRRGIYKDLYRSGKPFEDYQLRPNFPIAMTVATDLFDPQKALRALYLVDTVLRGPTGMATLDPEDLNYRPYYNNSEDSTDFATSKGRNYHQGPEWLWPTGYFLRAFMKFGRRSGDTFQRREDIIHQISKRVQGCKKALRSSSWKGLTELTNKNGAFCADSVSFSLLILLLSTT
jgi:glycogen debranching enzyme